MRWPNTTGTPKPPAPPPEGGQPAPREVDLHALAERLYRLLQEEARLECERLGRRRLH